MLRMLTGLLTTKHRSWETSVWGNGYWETEILGKEGIGTHIYWETYVLGHIGIGKHRTWETYALGYTGIGTHMGPSICFPVRVLEIPVAVVGNTGPGNDRY